MQLIERGIYYEDSYLGVTLGALIFSQGVIAIDAPLRPEETRSWRSALMNQRGGASRLLINLDAHPDRTLGSRALECTIIAHQKAALVFRNRPTIFKGQSIESGAVWETYNDAIGMRWASPDITFTERMYLHWGGPEVILEYRPGPTPGSIWVIIPDAHAVFVGDAVTHGQPPFLAQADLNDWLINLDWLDTSYRDFTIVCGRGGVATLDDIHHLSRLLKEINHNMERLASRNALPEATLEMLPSLLAEYTIPAKLRDLYTTRLSYGLQQCFVRRYRPTTTIGQSEIIAEEEQ
jgi:glyoxylase-like metal-dependent hydrolase (beta-lactamase superfamily II)